MGVKLGLILKEEHRLEVFQSRVLRIIFGPKRKWQEGGETCVMRNFIIYTLRKFIRLIKSRRMREACSTLGGDKFIQNFGRKT
jgi:hypothetical protein